MKKDMVIFMIKKVWESARIKTFIKNNIEFLYGKRIDLYNTINDDAVYDIEGSVMTDYTLFDRDEFISADKRIDMYFNISRILKYVKKFPFDMREFVCELYIEYLLVNELMKLKMYIINHELTYEEMFVHKTKTNIPKYYVNYYEKKASDMTTSYFGKVYDNENSLLHVLAFKLILYFVKLSFHESCMKNLGAVDPSSEYALNNLYFDLVLSNDSNSIFFKLSKLITKFKRMTFNYTTPNGAVLK